MKSRCLFGAMFTLCLATTLAVVFMYSLPLRLGPALAAAPHSLLRSSVTLYAVADASTEQSAPDQKSGADPMLSVARSGVVGPVDTYAYVRFDLSSIPTGSTIDSAQLQLYLVQWTDTGPYTVHAHAVTQSWDEGTICWNNQPPPGALVDAPALTMSGGYKSWNVQALVQDWVGGGQANHGVALLPDPQQSFQLIFASREAAANPPRLVIDYTAPLPTPTHTTGPCPDNYEPNDSFEQAPGLLRNTEYWAAICTAQDVDYYGLTVGAGDHVRAEIYNLPADFDLDLYSPDRSLMGQSTNGGTQAEWIEATAQMGGFHYIRVYGKQGAFDPDDPYYFKVTVEPGDTPTPTHSATVSPTSTDTPTPTATHTPIDTKTTTPTATATATASATWSPTPTLPSTTTPTPTATATVGPLADLVVTDLWAEQGLTCYQIHNAGQGTAPAGHRARLWVDGQVQVEDLIDMTLQPAQRLNRCFNTSWQCPGAQAQLRACADATNVLAESDEGNNCRNETWRCDTTAPLITSGPSVTARTETSVQVCWDSDEWSNSRLVYGRQAGRYGSTVDDPALVTHHCLTVPGLTPGTTYQYYVESSDAAGNRVSSRALTFRTLPHDDAQKPAVSLSLPQTLSGKAKIGASASDNVGVERVEFWLDGELVHTDLAAPYEFDCETRGLSDGFHGFVARAFDAVGNSIEASASADIRNHFEELLSPVHVRITSLSNEQGVYGSVPIVAEVTHDYSSTIRYLEFEVDGTVLASITYPPCSVIVGGPWGVHLELPCGATPLVESADWNATGLPSDSTHIIAVRARDESDNWGRASVRVTIDPPDPIVSVTRQVRRRDNWFEVTLAITNHSSVALRDIALADLSWGFQAINQCHVSLNGTVFGPAVACTVDYSTAARSSELHYPYTSLAAGNSLWVRYGAVPILFAPEEEVPWPTLGDRLTLSYQAYDRTYSQEPRTRWSSSHERALAFAASDYIVMTNPYALFDTDAAGEVNALLGTMADLAREKRGVLGYLPRGLSASQIKSYVSPGGQWAAKMGSSFSTPNPGSNPAYLLIVGEIEIVPSYTHDVHSLGITWSGGGRTDTVHRSDNYYADTVGGDSRPDLIVGRVIGNTAAQLLTPIQASLDVHRGSGFDLRYAVSLSGYEDGSGDTFLSDAENLPGDLSRQGFTTTVIHWSNWIDQSWRVYATEYDGYTLGDVNADGLDEVIIAHDEDGQVEIYQPASGTRIGHFGSAFGRYDGLAAGDVDADGRAEIVVAYNEGSSGGRLYAYEADGSLIDQLEVDYTDWDCLALGDALGDGWAGGEWINDRGRDEIVLISDETDLVYIYRLNDGRRLVLDYDSPWTPTADFTRHDGFAIGDVRQDWPKDEIVIIRNDDERIYLYNGDGSELARLSGDLNGDGTKDVRFTRYDGLALGDVDGDGEDEVLVICDEDEKVYVLSYRTPVGGWQTDAHYSRLLDSWFRGIRYTGSDTRHDGFAVGNLLAGMNERIGILRNLDGAGSTFYTMAPIWDEIDLLANRRLGSSAGNASIIAMHGHGNPWGASPIWRFYGSHWGAFNQHPLVFAMACSSGDYDAVVAMDNTFGEALFDHGAAAFIASTELSAIRHNHDTYVCYFEGWNGRWDPRSELAGRAFARYERGRADDSSRWKFWAIEYNYYGDPKFGARSVSTAAPAAPQAQAAVAPPAVVPVTVPVYQVESADGVDYVTIPGGTLLLEDDQPEVPIYSVAIEVPVGYQVQDVQLTSRQGLITTQGLNLPVFVPITATVAGAGEPALPATASAADGGGDGWYPAREFDWQVVPAGDGSSQLALTLYPFDYNALTTDVRFYPDYAFQIRYSTPGVTITALSSDKAAYEPAEVVEVSLGLNSSAVQDVVVEASVRRYGSEEWVDGLLLHTLSGLSGAASFALPWVSTGAAPGEYYVELVLRETGGDILDRASCPFRLGTASAQVLLLSATPQQFEIGEPVQIALQVGNTGTVALSGSFVLQVRDAAGSVVQTFEHPFSDLAPRAYLPWSQVWDTSAASPGVYTILGSVRYDSAADTAAVTVTAAGQAQLFLPLIMKNTRR